MSFRAVFTIIRSSVQIRAPEIKAPNQHLETVTIQDNLI